MNLDNQTCTNTYDDLARLSGNNCGSVWAQTFSYDAFGNASKSGSISWLPTYNSPASDNVTSNNQYKSGWNGVSYDANGDLLNDTFNTYTWDVYGNLATANGVTLTYDALGRMVENGNGASQFLYAPNGQHQLANMVGQQLASAFVPLPGGAVAVYYSSGLVQYNHSDWLGSARLFSTPTRTTAPAMAYAPFGEGYAGGQSYVQFTGINSWTVADAENQSGSLEDFMFRRYSPVQGRWISPDPAGLGAVDPSNPQSWNRYAYVGNAPLTATDPLGLFTDAVSTIDDCVTLPDCKTYYVNGMQVSAATAGSLIAATYVNFGSTPYIGFNAGKNGGPSSIYQQSVGADGSISQYQYNPPTWGQYNNGNLYMQTGGWGVTQVGTAGNGPANNGPCTNYVMANCGAAPLQQQQRVSWWQNFTHPNKQTCRNANILAASEAAVAFGFGTTALFAPVTAPVTAPAALAAGGSASLTKLYTAIACP